MGWDILEGRTVNDRDSGPRGEPMSYGIGVMQTNKRLDRLDSRLDNIEKLLKHAEELACSIWDCVSQESAAEKKAVPLTKAAPSSTAFSVMRTLERTKTEKKVERDG